MDIQYQKLFSIRCQHEYFGGDCNVLTLRPTDECERMLERYRCRFRPAAGGGSVWYGSHEDASLLRSFAERQPFQFTLTNTDSAFGLYTDLGPIQAAPDKTLYWYHNLEEFTVDQDGKQFPLLHPPGDAVQTLPVKGVVFRHQFDKPETASVLSVVHATDSEIGLEMDAPPDPFQTCSMNLSSLPEGRYRLQLDGNERLHFILSAQNPATQWGLIEIFARGPKPEVPEACRIIDENGKAQQKFFQIDFATQQTIWRYFIISQSRKGQSEPTKFDNYKVVGKLGLNTEPLLGFNNLTKTEIAGKEAWMFESSAPIPLYAQPGEQYSFHLLTKDDPDSADGIRLSYASAASTHAQREEGGVRLVSDIFQYL